MAELFDPTMVIGLFCYYFPVTLSQVHLELVGARHRVKNNPADNESPWKGNNFLKRSSPAHLTLSTDIRGHTTIHSPPHFDVRPDIVHSVRSGSFPYGKAHDKNEDDEKQHYQDQAHGIKAESSRSRIWIGSSSSSSRRRRRQRTRRQEDPAQPSYCGNESEGARCDCISLRESK